jgi:hypothetical protein
MEQPPLIPRAKWQPATFAERGVTVPFTTPVLAMARLRPGDGGQAEVIVANPSGADGSYVFPLKSLRDFTTPSMHDRLLIDILLELPAISPSDIRRAARRAATTGAAGRGAAKSAKAAAAREEQVSLLTNLLLITQLLRQAGFAEVDWRRLDLGDRETRATTRRYLTRYEAKLGMKPDAMLAVVEEMSPSIAPIGVAGEGFKAAHDVTIEQLERMVASLRAWSKGEAIDQAKGVELIACCAEFTIAKANDALTRARSYIDDMVGLISSFKARDKTLMRDLGMPDWLLDGWGEIAALWEAAAAEDREAQRAVIARIETLVPVLPKEAFTKADSETAPHRQLTQRRWVKLNQDWRAGSLSLDDASRVEQAKGLAA